MATKYKKAFKCNKCPESNGEDGCPAWNEIIMTKGAEENIVKGCNFQLMPWIMTEAIKASYLATGTASDMKNEVARGFSLMSQAMPNLITMLSEVKEDEAKEITVGDDE
jgi:hypothetical protein